MFWQHNNDNCWKFWIKCICTNVHINYLKILISCILWSLSNSSVMVIKFMELWDGVQRFDGKTMPQYSMVCNFGFLWTLMLLVHVCTVYIVGGLLFPGPNWTIVRRKMFKEHFEMDSIPNRLNFNIWIRSSCQGNQLLYVMNH